MIAAVVLAAGESRRMGQPKALLDLAGRTLIEAHVARLRSVVDVVTVIARPEVAAVLPPLDARVVARATSSQAASLAAALDGVEADVWIVTPVDLVPPRRETLRALLEALTEGVDAVTPEHAGRGGHPVVIRGSVLAPYRAGALLPLRDRLGEVRRVKVVVDDPRVLGDLDFAGDVARLEL